MPTNTEAPDYVEGVLPAAFTSEQQGYTMPASQFAGGALTPRSEFANEGDADYSPVVQQQVGGIVIEGDWQQRAEDMIAQGWQPVAYTDRWGRPVYTLSREVTQGGQRVRQFVPVGYGSTPNDQSEVGQWFGTVGGVMGGPLVGAAFGAGSTLLAGGSGEEALEGGLTGAAAGYLGNALGTSGALAGTTAAGGGAATAGGNAAAGAGTDAAAAEASPNFSFDTQGPSLTEPSAELGNMITAGTGVTVPGAAGLLPAVSGGIDLTGGQAGALPAAGGAYQPTTGLGRFMDDPIGNIGNFLSTSGVSWDEFLSNPGAYIGDLVSNFGDDVVDFFSGTNTPSLSGGGSTGGGALDWLPAVLGIASAVTADYSARDTLPEWIKPYTMDVLDRARADVDRPYQPYTGEAIAPMSGNERMAYDIAGQRGAQHMTPGFDYMGEARRYADRGAQEFPGDMSRYMDPYIRDVLDVAAGKMDERFQLERNRNRDMSRSRGAFGGTRGALLESRDFGNLLENQGNLYKTGLSEAWNRGAGLFQNDRDAAARASNQYGALAGVDQNIRNADLTNLRSTGELSRSLDQAQNTFDYEQFREGRDWSDTQLDQYAQRVAGTQTGSEIQPPDRTGAILGAIATGVGMANT